MNSILTAEVGVRYDLIEDRDGVLVRQQCLVEEARASGALNDAVWLASRARDFGFFEDIVSGQKALAICGSDSVMILAGKKHPILQKIGSKPLDSCMRLGSVGVFAYELLVCCLEDYESFLHPSN